ncbi:hypothetical protein [uncultured Nocardioides sp.]|uniref:hypothetical protein n=1 Tax=uncultured Nocardioides sp. TaxID=198441 RepID=UPI002615822A|nr:hypothetical protein [uncultured Nocardioides sp.]
MTQPTDEPQNGPENDNEPTGGPEGQDEPTEPGEGEQEPQGDTFPRSYVEKIRKESQNYRDRAKRGETALSRLTVSTVREATSGILVDPTDLTYDEESMSDEDGFPDPEKIKEAAEALIERKPHLAPRRPRGDIGQGNQGGGDDFSLASLLRQSAG